MEGILPLGADAKIAGRARTLRFLPARVPAEEAARPLPEIPQRRVIDAGGETSDGLIGDILSTRVLDRLKKVRQAADLRPIRMHDLRHTFATQLFTIGEPAKAVQELLGHTRITTTMDTYTASVPAVLRTAVDRLDETLGRGESRVG